MRFELPRQLLLDVSRSGGEILQVGGAVRDLLLGIDENKSKDLDLMIAGIDLDELNRILSRHGKTDLVGKSFGVIKFKLVGWDDEPIDISVPRVDNKIGESHTDFEVETGKHITVEQDLLRRDFTVNAIAMCFETGLLTDLPAPWDEDEGIGGHDIDHRLLRMVSPNSMEEDPLRILRGCQFSARFGLTVEPNTMENMRSNVHRIKTVSKDRFLEEFRKLFFKSPSPSVGLTLMKRVGVIRELFPKLNERWDLDLQAIDDLSKDNFVGFLALFFEPVKEDVEEIMTEFRFPKKDIDMVKDILNFLDRGWASDRELIRWNNDKKSKDDVIPFLDDLLNAIGKPEWSASERLRNLRLNGVATKIGELKVNGNDLIKEGFKGVEIGRELRKRLFEGVAK